MSDDQTITYNVDDAKTSYEKTSENISPQDFYTGVTVECVSSGDSLQTQESQSKSFPTSRLYPVEEKRGAELENSIRLLSEALDLAQEALECYQDENLFGSEDAMQRIHLILPELFCCRELGDGFGMVVIGLYHSYDSLEGEPFNKNQILEVKSLLKVLMDEPFLPTEEAIEKIIKLEESGLKVNPKRINSEKENPNV